MSTKFDGVVDAVRYKGGQIQLVRAYERRGPTFSDRVLLSRKELAERLKQGKKYFTGRRKEYLASTFDLDRSIRLRQDGGREVIVTGEGTDHDELEGLPILY